MLLYSVKEAGVIRSHLESMTVYLIFKYQFIIFTASMDAYVAKYVIHIYALNLMGIEEAAGNHWKTEQGHENADRDRDEKDH